MRRVAVTGVGAVTPLGLDAPSTWRAALAGESGVDWISAFDTEGLPVRVAGEVKGFDPAQVGEEGYGLVGMRERVALFDGRLQIESSAGGGTTLAVEVPVT